MKIMRFSFSAPLQSWGEDARWDNRSTALRPTKSAIIGFLGSCLGYPRGDTRLNRLNGQLRTAVRVDRPGRIMTDFHTVQGTNGVFLTAEGKKRSGGGTIITPKQYLQDAWFTVFLQGEDAVLDSCFAAMEAPAWTPYLGRKSCVPAVPVVPEWVDAETLEDAVRLFNGKEPVHSGGNVMVEMDMLGDGRLSDSERAYTRSDFVVHAERNEYGTRRVKSFTVKAGGGEC